MYCVEGYCISNIGKIRENNEDNFYFDGIYLNEHNNGTEEILMSSFSSKDNKAFAIFDGMGGHDNGERASFISAYLLNEYAKEHKIINWNRFADIANERICYEMSKNKKRMGSTMASIQFRDDVISIANLGDSRIYILIKDSLIQVSVDHNESQLNENIVTNKKKKSRLTQYLGIREDEMIIEPFNKKIKYVDIDKVLICSDGITDMIDDNIIEKIIKENNAKKTTQKLLETAMKNGGEDNTTIMVFEIKKEQKKNKFFNKIFNIIGGK